MPIDDETVLRGFCARILGWSPQREFAVEHAVRSIEIAASHRAALVLLGETDLVPVAQALHRRTLGPGQPFVLCDRRRNTAAASARAAANQGSGVAAVRAARGGTLCVRAWRLPDDFASVVRLVREPGSSVQLVVCADARLETHPLAVLPAPIRVPPLRTREHEVPRIIDEYARDAIVDLSAPEWCFTAADRAWILASAPRALGEIEKTTLRLVALRASKNPTRAAERLGMAPVSLMRWLARRKTSAT